MWNCSWVNATEHLWWYVNIGSGHGLVPSNNKPFPEAVLTQILSPYGVTRPQRVKTQKRDFFRSDKLISNVSIGFQVVTNFFCWQFRDINFLYLNILLLFLFPWSENSLLCCIGWCVMCTLVPIVATNILNHTQHHWLFKEKNQPCSFSCSGVKDTRASVATGLTTRAT